MSPRPTLAALVLALAACEGPAPEPEPRTAPDPAPSEAPQVEDEPPELGWPDCDVDNITGDSECSALRLNLAKYRAHDVRRVNECLASPAENTQEQCECWVYGDCDWTDDSHAKDAETPEERRARREANGVRGDGCEVANLTEHTSCKHLRFEISRRMRYHIERGDACESAGNMPVQCVCWVYGTCWDWTDEENTI